MLEFIVRPMDSVASLKYKINHAEGIAPVYQELRMQSATGDQILQDGRNLEDYNLKDGMIIELHLRAHQGCRFGVRVDHIPPRAYAVGRPVQAAP